ncbi:MAG: hypothetical protein KM310_10760 [Clostridiales bacterium]|nr:hypothetical protein [Clostridiales bacterium]
MRFKNIIPQPFDSEKQFLRYHHLDLPDLDSFRLWQEEEITKQILAWVDPKSEEAAWLLQRLTAIETERERRQGKAAVMNHRHAAWGEGVKA